VSSSQRFLPPSLKIRRRLSGSHAGHSPNDVTRLYVFVTGDSF
jgi:hypothetical protein